ncbi:MAG: aminotransferase class III-fold pyridoxal phosphate-dependent enzyme [Anaerolineae bacterium]|jgi:4-aminobutyrate aminotransferase-like enzyme/Ser/Thr protein kinase RdoA (MazF antagonist)|nr:aminotransferase class III-fold pyridoxal phosphate-dependent enzyme [Anaerolineae bacterium]MBT7190738.1 aminotransferase class III-fold pyridoxal phosphate-dependent enzyme [Anaerolineae bacterium]MBT7989726.1 aminotransferase class III-fold pyridoxal phosphate-dependent enzyme [Anaerolineae bacterium]
MPIPPITEKDAIKIAANYYNLTTEAKKLGGDIDRNFLLTLKTDRSQSYTLKIHSLDTKREEIEFQNAALQYLKDFEGVPRIIPNRDGKTIFTISYKGDEYLVRMLSYLEGTLLENIIPKPPNLLRGLGAYIAKLDLALTDFEHHATRQENTHWDLSLAPLAIEPRLGFIATPKRRELASRVLERFKRRVIPVLPDLHKQVIHNDANTQNLLTQDGLISGIFDFGDLCYAPRIHEVAICAAYALLNEENPIESIAHLTAGYHSIIPLTTTEISLFYDLTCARLAISGCFSSEREGDDRYDSYHQAHAKPVWEALSKLLAVDAEDATRIIGSMSPPRNANLTESSPKSERLAPQAIIKKREENLSKALSLSYENPLHIVRGQGQFLYDADGKSYLDCVNNVCHVGHSHPRVVAALAGQAAALNTNTRYLHENIIRLAERLTATMPPTTSGPLSVCFFVNSGSEANDLALRLARTYTGERDMLVLEGAYHGSLSSLVEISPYKFDGKGGMGAPDWVHKLAMPCSYRGVFREAEKPVERYALQAQAAIDAASGIAAFISESMIGTGGQVVFPEGYLAEIYARTRAAGGVCIADEVQNGFGRFGTHFWGFQSHGVVPDIVTMGKPMGNGHPLAAVVTTPEIAAAFDNGMEYFNTFGGNPVSCAVGLAMLDVIEEEGLQENALRAGAKLKAGLLDLMDRHSLIGDVRGEGLFLGIELVRDRATLEPAPAETHRIVEEMRNRQILLSVDGPMHNIVKIKPPIVFNEDDAARLVRELDKVLKNF